MTGEERAVREVLRAWPDDDAEVNGYYLWRAIRRRGWWRPSRLYPGLQALEDAGMVEARWEDSAYPRRRWYRLSDHGRVARQAVLGGRS